MGDRVVFRAARVKGAESHVTLQLLGDPVLQLKHVWLCILDHLVLRNGGLLEITALLG